MIKTYSIKDDKDFQNLINKGKWYGGEFLSLYVLDNKKELNFIGLGVSKKVGNAVKRNYVKRIIRESYKNIEKDIKYGFNLFFVCKNKANFDDINYELIYNDIVYLLKKAGLLE